MKVYHTFRNNELPVYMQNWPMITNNEIHQYNTRIASYLHPFRYYHTFARKPLRHYLVQTLNNTPDNVFSKFGTHSLNGFLNYVKLHFINNYQYGCNITNCYIMFWNIANQKCNIAQSLLQAYTQPDIHMQRRSHAHPHAHTHAHTHTRTHIHTHTGMNKRTDSQTTSDYHNYSIVS